MTVFIIILPLVTLALAMLNIKTWPRGHRLSTREASQTSVLIPARDEQDGIEACVRSVFDCGDPVLEVLVYDDGSTDATPQILARLAQQEPRLRVIQGGALPAGWVGKPHACHQLAGYSRGEHLLFLDADARLLPRGISRLRGMAEDLKADLVTAVPQQQMQTWAEQLVLPLLHLTYLSWFPLVLTYLSRDVRFLAANGQVLWMRRESYEEVGGFEAVRHEVVDDMALCRRAKTMGQRVVFADGQLLARCRMYSGARQVWQGFSKNLYPGLGARPLALALVLALYTLAFLLPWAAAAYGLLVDPAWLAPALIGVGANLSLRLALVLAHRHPVSSLVLHPLSILAFIAIAVNSWWWTTTGRLQWRGRTYPASPGPTASAPGVSS